MRTAVLSFAAGAYCEGSSELKGGGHVQAIEDGSLDGDPCRGHVATLRGSSARAYIAEPPSLAVKCTGVDID